MSDSRKTFFEKTDDEPALAADVRAVIRSDFDRVWREGPRIPMPGSDRVLTAAEMKNLSELTRLIDQWRKPAARTGEASLDAGCLSRIPWKTIGGHAIPFECAAASAKDPTAALGEPFSFAAGFLKIQLPVAEVPYGVARIIAREMPSNRLLNTFLIYIPLSDSDAMRECYEPIVERLKGVDLRTVDPVIQPATDDPEVLKWFTIDEVRALFEDESVASSSAARNDIERLCRMLNEAS